MAFFKDFIKDSNSKLLVLDKLLFIQVPTLLNYVLLCDLPDEKKSYKTFLTLKSTFLRKRRYQTSKFLLLSVKDNLALKEILEI